MIQHAIKKLLLSLDIKVMHYSSLCNTNISSPLSKNEKIIPKSSKKSVYAAVSFELREGVPLLQVFTPISAADAILGAARGEPPWDLMGIR